MTAVLPSLESKIELRSILTCPACGHEASEAMPTDACLFFWECPACAALARPKPGDCCVFCSYGTLPCPPMQEQAAAPHCCG